MKHQQVTRSPGLHLIELAGYQMILCVTLCLCLSTIVLVLAANAIKRVRIRIASKDGAKQYARKVHKTSVSNSSKDIVNKPSNIVNVEESLNNLEVLVGDLSTDLSDESRQRFLKDLQLEKAKLRTYNNISKTLQ